MNYAQPGILDDVPAQARYLTFSINPEGDLRQALKKLAALTDGTRVVVGIGTQIVDALGVTVPGLTKFPRIKEAQVDIPTTNVALWCWLRGDDRGELVLLSRDVTEQLKSALSCDSIIDSFQYDIGRDLTGYEDGTENPQDSEALDAGILSCEDAFMNGSSFVAVQQWVHNLDDFFSLPQNEQDDIIGRRKIDNEEFEEAPDTAHVKRTAQENFEPEAFILRRSMPWADSSHEGLNFVAFGKSFDAFDMQLKRMSGAEDGVVDALFSFTTPVTGSYFWCPPMLNGSLNLKQLEL